MREKHHWGDYYLSGGRKTKKSWALEMVHSVNQIIPTFNELFDERDSIKQFLLHKDVIVQSPTGSGKTLAYLLSVFAILLKVKQIWLAKETAALILVPNRELALQIFDVANHFGEALNIRIRVLLGGKKSKYYAKKVADEGVNVLIATPGRLEHLIVSDGNFKKSLKSLEILIVDEADRFTESVFKRRCVMKDDGQYLKSSARRPSSLGVLLVLSLWMTNIISYSVGLVVASIWFSEYINYIRGNRWRFMVKFSLKGYSFHLMRRSLIF